MNDQALMAGSEGVLSAQQLSKRYQQGSQSVSVLNELDIELQSGERVAIIGNSGCGKSTLLHLLSGLLSPSSGTVSVKGENLTKLGPAARGRLRNRYMGFVYQFHHLLAEFTALENVGMPLMIGGASPASVQEKSRELLERVGLGERVTHKPGELSGGERQRAAIARALINNPAVVLADEPTGNLDETTASSVADLLLELNQEEGTALVIVTHDKRLARRMDRILTLTGGTLVEGEQ